MTPYGPCKPRARTTNAPARRSSLLTDDLKDRSIRSLATDFPTLWSNPDTPQRDRTRTVRLVDDVTLHKTDRVHLHVRLRGGQATSLGAVLDHAVLVKCYCAALESPSIGMVCPEIDLAVGSEEDR